MTCYKIRAGAMVPRRGAETEMATTECRLTAAEIQAELRQFHGSDTVYMHSLFRAFRFTEGARFVAQHAEAYWLLDAIFSHQINPAARAEEFQAWKLAVDGSAGSLTMTDGDTDVPVIEQVIPYTDFPLSEMVLWFENRTLFLPSER